MMHVSLRTKEKYEPGWRWETSQPPFAGADFIPSRKEAGESKPKSCGQILIKAVVSGFDQERKTVLLLFLWL
jgi:hypothetical protein